MTNAAKMAMVRSMNGDRGGEMRGGDMRNDMRGDMRGNAYGNSNMRSEMRNEMRGEMENAFRDNRGRRHYDNGRFAPKSEMDGGMESAYHEPPHMTDTFEGREVMGFRAGGNVVNFPGGNEMQNRGGSMEHGKGEMKGGKLDKHMVEQWLSGMKNTDGSKGPHWSFEQAKSIVKQRGIEHDPLMFWATMNMMYSDYSEVAQKYGLNNQDYYVDLACAFLDDEDVRGDKLSKYYFGVVKR